MATPARQRILNAALVLIRQKGIGRVTTREIALAAGAAEGSLFKNFGDKMGLLTELLSYELPENQAWRAVAIEAPPGHGDLAAGLVLFMQRAIDYYAASLPLTAGSLADRELLRRHLARNRERDSGPQLALQATVDCLRGWQEAGYLDQKADLYPMAVALCGGALICAYIEALAGPGKIRGGRDGLIHSLIDSAVAPHVTKDLPGRS